MIKLIKTFFVDVLLTGTGLAMLIILVLLGLHISNRSELKAVATENKQLVDTVEGLTDKVKKTTAALNQTIKRRDDYKTLSEQMQSDLATLKATTGRDEAMIKDALENEQNKDWASQSVPADVASVFNQ